MKLNFTFSDTIAGYISGPLNNRNFKMKTSDGREFSVSLTDSAYARFVMNLGEGWQGANMDELLSKEGQMLFAYGTFYPGDEMIFEAQSIIFPGNGDDYRQEHADWWVNQIDSIAHTYLKWQFNHPNEAIDYDNYRTRLALNGEKKGDGIQETDTISRLVFGLASAYLLTGKDEFLEGAEKGTEYLRKELLYNDAKHKIKYWCHALNVEGGKKTQLLTSVFPDDYGAIPAYEQIYAIAGPTQTYRITGDPKIMSDIEETIRLFEEYYKDNKQGGYYSHLSPDSLSAHEESLGQNKARKNWNSVGDHAPAYLVNLYLATGEKKYADFLEYTFDTITKYFQDYENSPFVQEKFFEDWSKDQKWGWQQNRGVVGHNLKIAWNLMRMQSLKSKDSYLAFATKIAEIMPNVGCDLQRGGWYDVLERVYKPNGKQHQFVWHDRKAWWQQEQGILAYLILHGSLGNDEYLKYARESAAFYNAYFLDGDDGGVYFNTLASGMPYLLGTERLKGSHSMSGYHSMELCYLAAVYTNLLITKTPMNFYFKPYPTSFKDGILRVSPDILPNGSIFIEECFIDDQPYTDFDADTLTVTLPKSDKQVRVRVKISPKS